MTREQLENNQIWLYGIVVVLAAGVGLLVPELSGQLDVTISVVIAILMYSMFSQIPFTALKESFANRRYIGALMTVNYIAVPIIVWLLATFLPEYPPLLLGVYLVLLTPCIDYVIVFTALGRGNEKLVLMSTPLLFITQLLLLPLVFMALHGRGGSGNCRSCSIFRGVFGSHRYPASHCDHSTAACKKSNSWQSTTTSLSMAARSVHGTDPFCSHCVSNRQIICVYVFTY